MNRRNSAYTKNLIIPIVDASLSDKWEEAVLEWDIIDCEEDKKAETQCMCGHEGIRYLFHIRNRFTGREFDPIGSECIKKFGRKDLSSEVDVQERLFRLYEAMTTDVRITLDSTYFSRKLLMYLLDDDAFRPTQYNGNDGANDYQFLLDMFNRRDKDSISSAQERKINAILAFSIRPYLSAKLAAKRR